VHYSTQDRRGGSTGPSRAEAHGSPQARAHAHAMEYPARGKRRGNTVPAHARSCGRQDACYPKRKRGVWLADEPTSEGPKGIRG
jgi:hypothetical protein